MLPPTLWTAHTHNRQLTSTLSTEQSFIPQDTATVGGTPNNGFDGTVDFRLYAGDTLLW